ncbi:MAG: nucleotidyltransferase family protein [Planctomycetes bacterium]|nr:nucleotidyltransferase family protein [Planctomycetota bacterium]
MVGIDALAPHRARILELARRHGVRRLRVFGSFARGTAREESDLDLIADLEPDRTLFDLGAFGMDLEELLGRRVDLVTEPALHWSIRETVLSESKPL